MIDEPKAKEKVETMNRANFQNLLMALQIERYLFQIFGSAIDTAYSPEVGTLIVRNKDPRSNAMKNIVASVRQSVHESTIWPPAWSGKQARLFFPGGFSVLVMAAEENPCSQ